MQRDLNISAETGDMDEDNEYTQKVNLSYQEKLEKIQLPQKNKPQMKFENGVNTNTPSSISRTSSFDKSN